MSTPELLNFIEQQTKEGKTKEEIREILLASEWARADVDEAFATIVRSDEETTVPTPSIPKPSLSESSVTGLPARTPSLQPAAFPAQRQVIPTKEGVEKILPKTLEFLGLLFLLIVVLVMLFSFSYNRFLDTFVPYSDYFPLLLQSASCSHQDTAMCHNRPFKLKSSFLKSM